MNPNVIVIDDFYKDFESVRQLALSEEYPVPHKDYPYPGRNSKSRHFPENALERISKIIGTPVYFEERLSTGHFRYSFQNDPMKSYVHYDDADWSGVLYLNLPDECRAHENAGTILWKHKETKLEIVPDHRIRSDEAQQIINRDGLDLTKWEKLFQVPMKSNRLILFRATHWHSHGYSFGNSLNNCRLIHLFFFHEGIKSLRI